MVGRPRVAPSPLDVEQQHDAEPRALVHSAVTRVWGAVQSLYRSPWEVGAVAVARRSSTPSARAARAPPTRGRARAVRGGATAGRAGPRSRDGEGRRPCPGPPTPARRARDRGNRSTSRTWGASRATRSPGHARAARSSGRIRPSHRARAGRTPSRHATQPSVASSGARSKRGSALPNALGFRANGEKLQLTTPLSVLDPSGRRLATLSVGAAGDRAQRLHPPRVSTPKPRCGSERARDYAAAAPAPVVAAASAARVAAS